MTVRIDKIAALAAGLAAAGLLAAAAPSLARPEMAGQGGMPGGMPGAGGAAPAQAAPAEPSREVTAAQLWSEAKPADDVVPGARTFGGLVTIRDRGLVVFETGSMEDWDRYWFDPAKGPGFSKILRDDPKVAFDKLDALFRAMKDHAKKVILLDAGYMVIFMQGASFMLPVTPSTVEKIRKF